MECDYQGTSDMLLRKHITLKHSSEQFVGDETIKCRICAKQFNEKWKFMIQRKNDHQNAVAYCRK